MPTQTHLNSLLFIMQEKLRENKKKVREKIEEF
jgi:hypothetical protein